MTDLDTSPDSKTQSPSPYQPKHKIRLVTATSLFDGHDASINIMRRIAAGLRRGGHPPRDTTASVRGDRRVRDRGGRARHRDHELPGRPQRVLPLHASICSSSGAAVTSASSAGAAVSILPERDRGAARLRRRRGSTPPMTAAELGLEGMISDMLEKCDFANGRGRSRSRSGRTPAGSRRMPARRSRELITRPSVRHRDEILRPWAASRSRARCCEQGPVLGITGTGGFGQELARSMNSCGAS
jgi:methylmalonyl-CoA mutase